MGYALCLVAWRDGSPSGGFYTSLSLLALFFLVLFIGLEMAGIGERYGRLIRAGLFAAGVPWVILAAVRLTGERQFLWGIPVVFGAVLACGLLKGLGWCVKTLAMKLRRGWRCPNCRKENEAIAKVCYFCQAWRPGL